MNKAILFLTTLSYFLAPRVYAHVGYVITPEKTLTNTGSDWRFLTDAAVQPVNLALIITAVVIIGLITWLFRKNLWLRRETRRIEKRSESYHEFIPWILRLSLGIALIGAGTSQALVSPIISEILPEALFIQILLGFLLLAGFLLAPAALATIFLYFLALKYDFYLLGNLDFLGLALALLILGNPRPGIDDLVGVPFLTPLRNLRRYVPLILRLCVGGAMIFLALYEKILNPHLARLVVEEYSLTSFIPVSPAMWVLSVGLIELLVGLFLVFGFKTRIIATVAFFILTLSFFFFKENVYSHITLFGALSVLLITGCGKTGLYFNHDERKIA
jgi:uncharacterized membrane protein YphA (DoxX/SURF4 family)/multisubunit Na+/H+ antiporter MnhC subunit